MAFKFKTKNSHGFTLIELILAMSFISVLLLAIALTVIQISNIYTRGTTLKEVNVAGRALSSELQRSIASSSPFTITPGDSSDYRPLGDWGGRLCLGEYSYIWNYGKALKENAPLSGSLNVYSVNPTDPNKQISMVKVLDPSGVYCSNTSLAIDPAKAVELVNVSDRTLAIHSFEIESGPSAIDTKTKEQLYMVTFFIGTNDQSALVDSKTGCKDPGDNGSNLMYCSIQEFTIVARAGN